MNIYSTKQGLLSKKKVYSLYLSSQVLVNDHLDEPIKNVQVRLVDQQLFRNGRFVDDELCPESATSGSDGLAIFICNTPRDALKANLKVRGIASYLPEGAYGISLYMHIYK